MARPTFSNRCPRSNQNGVVVGNLYPQLYAHDFQRPSVPEIQQPSAPEMVNNVAHPQGGRALLMPPAHTGAAVVTPATFPFAYVAVANAPPSNWSSGLVSGCCGDPGGCHACLFAWLCPSLAFGLITETMTDGQAHCGPNCRAACASHFLLGGCITMWNPFFCQVWTCWTCSHLLHVPARTALRKKYNIPGSELGDCCEVFWCEPCALVQERKELQTRFVPPVASVVMMVPNAQNAMYSHGTTTAAEVVERPRSGGKIHPLPDQQAVGE